MRRHAIGVIALVLLAFAGVLWLWPNEGNTFLGLEAACWRVGALMGVLWVAYTDVQRIPAWLLGIVPPLVVLLAWKPRSFLVVAPIILAIAILRPRSSHSPRKKPKSG
ncbi:MAG: hypothetical protein U9N87_12255 [Planctomycetota bacterium]|nr:hypothetical protein [Planctomycetota bacterium]